MILLQILLGYTVQIKKTSLTLLSAIHTKAIRKVLHAEYNHCSPTQTETVPGCFSLGLALYYLSLNPMNVTDLTVLQGRLYAAHKEVQERVESPWLPLAFIERRRSLEQCQRCLLYTSRCV